LSRRSRCLRVLRLLRQKRSGNRLGRERARSKAAQAPLEGEPAAACEEAADLVPEAPATAQGWIEVPTLVPAPPLEESAPEVAAVVRAAAAASGLDERGLRNVALEAVRVGNYWSENQQEVVEYIAQNFQDLLADAKFMKKNKAKLQDENAFVQKYSLFAILEKRHEVDGFDVFVPADDAVAAKEAKAKAKQQESKRVEAVDAGKLDEAQDGINNLVAAAKGEVGADEVIELVELAARAGELGAAVWCAEQLEEMHEDGLPDALLARAFEELKLFLRPSYASPLPRLKGPWQELQFGWMVPNMKKRLGKMVDRLSKLRRERELAKGGAAAQKADEEAAGNKVLGRLCRRLLPHLSKDQEALACRRRGPLVAAIVRVCGAHGLAVSTAVGYDVLKELEEGEHLHRKGREVSLTIDPEALKESGPLKQMEIDMKLLDRVSRDRLDRKRKRMQARQQARTAKRQRRTASG